MFHWTFRINSLCGLVTSRWVLWKWRVAGVTGHGTSMCHRHPSLSSLSKISKSTKTAAHETASSTRLLQENVAAIPNRLVALSSSVVTIKHWYWPGARTQHSEFQRFLMKPCGVWPQYPSIFQASGLWPFTKFPLQKCGFVYQLEEELKSLPDFSVFRVQMKKRTLFITMWGHTFCGDSLLVVPTNRGQRCPKWNLLPILRPDTWTSVLWNTTPIISTFLQLVPILSSGNLSLNHVWLLWLTATKVHLFRYSFW